MKKACVLLLALWPLLASADPGARAVTGEELLRGALSRPAGQLAEAQVVTGRFTHQKHLRELRKPLAASGEFIFARELGVYWHTQKPYDSVVVLTSTGILEKSESNETLRLSADEQPAVRMIASVFLALFTLDMTSLERNFRLFTEPAAAGHGRWSIALEPRGGAIANVFARAIVSGYADVEQVVLTDVHGERTVIDLVAVNYDASPPSAATRALFAPTRP